MQVDGTEINWNARRRLELNLANPWSPAKHPSALYDLIYMWFAAIISYTYVELSKHSFDIFLCPPLDAIHACTEDPAAGHSKHHLDSLC